MKFRKLLSGVLACALVVTSAFTGNVTTVKAADPQPTQLAQPVSSYKFNVSGDDAQPSLGKGVVLKQSANNSGNNDLNDYTAAPNFVAGRSGQTGDYAVDTQGKHGIVLPDKELGANYTVSFWVKTTGDPKSDWATSIVFIGRAMQGPKWVSVTQARLWGVGEKITKLDKAIWNDQWKMVTVVQTGNNVDLYVNGERKYTRSDINAGMEDADQFIALGANHWDGNYPGVYDDVYVYDQALTADQIRAIYMKDGGEVAFEAIGVLGEGESADYIKTDLNLPETFKGTTLAWESKDTTKIADDGTVKVFDGSKVTLTAKAAFSDGSKWSQDYEVTLAKEVTIKYVNQEASALLKSKTEKYKVADSYTYTLQDADKVWTTDDEVKTTYVYAGTGTAEELTTTHAKAEITLPYKVDVVTSVAEIPSVTTRVGIEPTLQKTVEATFSSGDKRQVEIDWSNVTEDTYAAAGTKKILAGVGSKTVEVELIVKDKADYLIADYTFDKGSDGLEDAVEGSEKVAKKQGTEKDTVEIKEGLKGNAAYFPGGLNGTAYIELPDDLLKVDGANAKDITISLFSKREITGNSFAMSLLAKSVVVNKNGKDEQQGSDYIGLINHDALRAEYKMGNAEKGRAAASQGSTKGEWSHFAIIVDSSHTTMSLYLNGKFVSKVTNSDIDITKFEAGLKNYLGFSVWPDNDYEGAIDEFKIYNTILTDKEIKTICDETLYSLQMEKTLKGLETLETWDGLEADLNNVVDDLKLPAAGAGAGSKITWESTNTDVINVETPGNGIVTQPYGEGAEDAEVTLTATIQVGDYAEEAEVKTVTFDITVPKRDSDVDKKPLRHAISDARDEYAAAKENSVIYLPASFAKLKTAYETAEAALKRADLTNEEVDQMIETLNEARKLQYRNLDQLKDAGALAAWYKLDKDATDASGNGADASAATSITFSESEGAKFPGCTNKADALKQIINLPTSLKVTNQMTFSFRMRSDGTKNFFGIGSLLSENGSNARHFHMTSEVFASVSNNGWSAHKALTGTISGTDVWHDAAVVLDGRTMTLYVDGKKIGTQTTDITMTQAWNAQGGTKYAYLGNCAYGNNHNDSDLDFKGNVLDVRIYNAALAEEQIGYITAYRDGLPMTYAKDEVTKAMNDLGAAKNTDGTYALDIIEKTDAATKTIALPKKVYDNKINVEWTAEGTDADIINLTTGAVTIPETAGTVKNLTLKAAITVDGKTETYTYICRVYRDNLDKDELNTLYNKLKAYTEDNYTAASYNALQAVLKEVYDEMPSLPTQEAVEGEITKLENAEKALVDISGLRALVDELEAEMVDLEEEDYTETSWKDFEDELKKANGLLEDAKDENADPVISESVVTSQKNALTAAREGLKECGSKEPLTIAIGKAEALSKYQASYTGASWTALQGALETAKGKLNERLEDYTPAATALNTAMNNLVVEDDHKLEGEVKTQLQSKLTEAKAEAQNLTKDNYTDISWQNYQKALDDLEDVLDKDYVTKEQAQDAAAAVEAARAELAPISEAKATSAEKTSLQNAIDGVITAGGDYTEESWTEYQNAKAAVDKLLERMNAEKHNVTKEEVTKAVAALNTAAQGLEPTEDQRLTEDDTAALAKAVTDAKALNLTYYTAESKKTYQDALADLEALTRKNNATRNEVKAAEEALATAKAGLTLTDEQTPTPEKKQEFANAYKDETDRGLKAADYTEESWARYQAALTAAADLSERLSQDNNKVAKDEIDAVIAELKAAYEALEPTAPATDKTALNKAIAAAEKLVQKTYTASTWDAFQTALTNAKNISTKADATQTQIDNAEKDLTAKQKALKIAVTKITITDKVTGGKAPKITAGKKVTLKAAVSPAGANSGVTWSVDSKSKKYASVSKTGVVTTKKAGAGKKATIIATATDGSKKTGKITITLMKDAVKKVTLKAAKKSVKAGKTVTIKATVKTTGKKVNKTLFWKSSNTKYATVNSKGKVTTKKTAKGKTVTITATATDGTGKKASVKIKITK